MNSADHFIQASSAFWSSWGHVPACSSHHKEWHFNCCTKCWWSQQFCCQLPITTSYDFKCEQCGPHYKLLMIYQHNYYTLVTVFLCWNALSINRCTFHLQGSNVNKKNFQIENITSHTCCGDNTENHGTGTDSISLLSSQLILQSKRIIFRNGFKLWTQNAWVRGGSIHIFPLVNHSHPHRPLGR
jgi:hypothetical protein